MDDRDALIAELWECGTTGIIENPDTVQAFFNADAEMSQVVSRLPYPVLEKQRETDLTAPSAIRQNADPVHVGQHFFVVSSGMEHPTPLGRRRLTIDASNSFGSGSHESTQLVIQALEEHLHPGATVLDVGCGSGILSAVAQELGAGQVFACDTHIGALDSARRHSRSSHFFAGSIDAVDRSTADVIIVNISARIITLLMNELRRVSKPAALLVLAGFISDRTPVGIRPEQVLELNGWECWLCRPESAEMNEHQPSIALQPFPEQWW